MSFFVYILRCKDGSLYTGVTNNYELRVSQHQEGTDPHAYTYSRRPVSLVHLEAFSEIGDAIAREKQLKRWSRKKKEALIRGEGDNLPELSLNQYAKRVKAQKQRVRGKISSVMVSPSNHGNACPPSASSG